MVECLECGKDFDKDNVPLCEAYGDDKTRCFDVRMCEGCDEREAEIDDFCERCNDEAEQVRRDQEWDYWHA